MNATTAIAATCNVTSLDDRIYLDYRLGSAGGLTVWLASAIEHSGARRHAHVGRPRRAIDSTHKR